MTKTLTQTLTRMLCTGSIAMSLASAAHAVRPSENFEVAFKYSRTARVEQTHADFKRTARKACFSVQCEILMRTYLNAQRDCQVELTEKAVRETGLAELIAYHAHVTGETIPDATPAAR
ncbi:MAG: hypothetical protein RIB03_12865 [Henriciella sp.]|uniref:hypothetical protein n=1 Tax=Henriciella sp. TaxID=1968823 RepID=UPI0032EE3E3F